MRNYSLFGWMVLRVDDYRQLLEDLVTAKRAVRDAEQTRIPALEETIAKTNAALADAINAQKRGQSELDEARKNLAIALGVPEILPAYIDPAEVDWERWGLPRPAEAKR